jgi:hypothetical protein
MTTRRREVHKPTHLLPAALCLVPVPPTCCHRRHCRRCCTRV